MASDFSAGRNRGKRLKACARFLACYGRTPDEFSEVDAMGLYANIETVNAERSLTLARGIAMAMGDEKATAAAVFAVTGNARLASKVEVAGQLARVRNG